MRKLLFSFTSAAILILAGCSDAPTTAEKGKAPEKAPEPATGQSAVYKMYQVARSWAPDAQVLKLNSILLNEVPNVPRGKAAAWEAVFTSPSRGAARSYTYSIVDVPPTMHKGVFAGPESSWSGAGSAPTAPFPIMAVKVDTEAAYKTALEKSEDYDKKNPDKPILLVLEKTTRFPNPVWRVVWGESVGTSNFSIYVDASTGDYKERMH